MVMAGKDTEGVQTTLRLLTVRVLGGFEQSWGDVRNNSSHNVEDKGLSRNTIISLEIVFMVVAVFSHDPRSAPAAVVATLAA
jgi:hypothetical protein